MSRSALALLALAACSPGPAPAESLAVREAMELRTQVERMELAATREWKLALAINAVWATNEALRCRGIKEAK